MSIFGIHILSDKQVSALKSAGHEVAGIALTEVQHAVAALKSTEIGKGVVSDINIVASKSLSGVEKFEQVVANTAPLVLKYVTGGGVSAALADVESIARELVQSTFNDVKSTKAGTIAGMILSLLKIK